MRISTEPNDCSSSESIGQRATPSRRRILQTLAGAGVGVNVFIKRASGSAPTIEINTRFAKEETKRVPRDWYNDYKRADRVNQEHDFHHKDDDLIGQWLVPGEFGGKNTRIDVEVRSDSSGDARGKVPEEKDEVPINVVDAGERRNAAACADHLDDDEFLDIPGGVQWGADNDKFGTICPRFRNLNKSGVYFGSARHIFQECKSGAEGEFMYQPSASADNTQIGRVIKALNFEDFVAAEPENSHNPLPKVVKASSASNSCSMGEHGTKMVLPSWLQIMKR